METVISRNKPFYRKHSRAHIDSGAINMGALIENMKRSKDWTNGDLKSMVISNSPDEQIVLSALHKDTQVISFQSNDSVTFQIIEGELKFFYQKKSVILDKGQWLTIKDRIKYSLSCNKETVFLLTIASNNKQPS